MCNQNKMFNFLWCYPVISLFLINADKIFGSTEPLIDEEHQKFEENVIKIEKIQLKRSTVRLYNLNPFINKWFLLEIKGSKTYRIHMESRNKNFKISLIPHPDFHF